MFASDIRHISGHASGPADTLSGNVTSILPENPAPYYEEIAASQCTDKELQSVKEGTSLHFKTFSIPASSVLLWCDVLFGQPRPFIPPTHHKSVF